MISQRMAATEDIDLLVRLRFDYFAEENWFPTPEERSAMTQNFQTYYGAHLNRDCFVVLVEQDGEVVSTALIVVFEKPANWFFPTGRVGTILNVLTYPAYRGKGLATRALQTLIGIAREQGLSYIDLSASARGLPLYEKLGFRRPEETAFQDLHLSLL